MKQTFLVFLGISLLIPCTLAQKFGSSCPSCKPGSFCGTDNTCHKWTCQSFYEFGDPALTGYGSTGSVIPLTCFGLTTGKDENLHAVVFGCGSVFPGAPIETGQAVSEPYNSLCRAINDVPDNFLQFDCYELRQYASDLVSQNGTAYNDNADEKTHNFRFFTQAADSLFPTCEDGAKSKYFYPITSTNRYTSDVEGLFGNPIISSKSSPTGDTTWQTNPSLDFDETLGLQTIYANVTIQKPPGGDTGTRDFSEGASGGSSSSTHNSHSSAPSTLRGAGSVAILAVISVVGCLTATVW